MPRKRKHPSEAVSTQITPDTAYAVWLSLGPGATFSALEKALKKLFGASPTQRTLSLWHGHRGWETAAQAHWRELQSQVAQQLKAQQPDLLSDRVQTLSQLCNELIGVAATMLNGGGRLDSGVYVPAMKLKGNPSEVATLIRAATEASTHVQLLTGQATERTEHRLLKDLDDEAIVQAYEREFGVSVKH